jgi:hypothetical protein
MIAFIAAVLTAQYTPPQAEAPATLDTRKGDWVMVTVHRVLAPDQIPGQCFVQAKVDQVVHGETYKPGQAVALTVPCRAGGLNPAVTILGQQAPTIETLRTQKRALVHLDAGGRVLQNGYYALGQAIPLAPELS